MSQARRSKRLRSQTESEDAQSTPQSASSPSPTSSRAQKEPKREEMDDTVDYAALVNNYLADERMARQLQEEEQAILAPRVIHEAQMSHNNETITISDDTDSEESDSEDDDTERGVGRLAPVLFRNLSRDEDETYRDNDFMRPDDMNVEDPYEESDIPQRRSAVLAPVHVETDRRNRASVVIRGNRNSVASILNARAAMRNVHLGSRGFEVRLIDEVLSTMAQHPFDMSMADEPIGLSDAQINRLPRTKPTQSQLENSCNFSLCTT